MNATSNSNFENRFPSFFPPLDRSARMISLRPVHRLPVGRSVLRRNPIPSRQNAFSRFYSTTPSSSTLHPPGTSAESPVRLAIVGGGLGGLSSAFYFLRNLNPVIRKRVEVVIFEKDRERTGGWCRSVRIDSRDKGDGFESGGSGKGTGEGRERVFETGPRSIRPVGLAGWLTVEMVSTSPSLSSLEISLKPLKGQYDRTQSDHLDLPTPNDTQIFSFGQKSLCFLSR